MLTTQATSDITRIETGADGTQATFHRVERRIDVPTGKARLELCGSSIEIHVAQTTENGAIDWDSRVDEEISIRFFSVINYNTVRNGVVDYVSRKFYTAEKSDYSSDSQKAEAREILSAIAGAMGLTYPAPTVEDPAAEDVTQG